MKKHFENFCSELTRLISERKQELDDISIFDDYKSPDPTQESELQTRENRPSVNKKKPKIPFYHNGRRF